MRLSYNRAVRTALSSRGLGRGPLKAQTRVRIPLALPTMRGYGLIVYRLGRHPFTVQRGVRFPLGLSEDSHGFGRGVYGHDVCRNVGLGQAPRHLYRGP